MTHRGARAGENALENARTAAKAKTENDLIVVVYFTWNGGTGVFAAVSRTKVEVAVVRAGQLGGLGHCALTSAK